MGSSSEFVGALSAPASMALTCRVEEPSTASEPDSRTAAKRVGSFSSFDRGVVRHGAASVLLENLVGTAGQRQRNSDAQRTSSLQVEEHLNFRRPLHRQAGGLVTFKNSASVDSD